MFDVYYTNRWPIIDCWFAVWISFRPSTRAVRMTTVRAGWASAKEKKNHNSWFKTDGWRAGAALPRKTRTSPSFHINIIVILLHPFIRRRHIITGNRESFIHYHYYYYYYYYYRTTSRHSPWHPRNFRKNGQRKIW